MTTNSNDIQLVWDAEIEILDQLDQFCRKNNLKYSLAYGTLIGAVRHGGFIPWDDDVDVVMPRADYDYLLANWDVSGFVLQNKETSPDFNQNFTKIRKDHTTFIQFEFEKTVSYHKGVFIDVFPGDRVAPAGIQRSWQYFCCALNLLYSREGVVSKKETGLEKLLMRVPAEKRETLRHNTAHLIQKWNDNCDYELFFPSTIRDSRIYYNSDLFDNMIDIEFSGRRYMCVREYDRFLRTYYGNYMKLPPENERVLKHHPIIVDLERNYDEIK